MQLTPAGLPCVEVLLTLHGVVRVAGHHLVLDEVRQLGFGRALFHRGGEQGSIDGRQGREAIGFADEGLGVEAQAVLQVALAWLEGGEADLARPGDTLVHSASSGDLCSGTGWLTDRVV